jgi:hypothetical protein
MSDSLLNIFKLGLLALLYLFFARVLWAVWSEVRGPRAGAATPLSARNGGIPNAPHGPGADAPVNRNSHGEFTCSARQFSCAPSQPANKMAVDLNPSAKSIRTLLILVRR